MANFSSLRITGLLAIAGMISGCDRPWTLWTSWPGPYMVLNTDGLGTGPIGNYLRKDQWGHSEVDLEHGIAELINERSSTKAISREDAESLGVQCAPAPSTECSYSGELWFRVGPLPPESPHYGKRTVVN